MADTASDADEEDDEPLTLRDCRPGLWVEVRTQNKHIKWRGMISSVDPAREAPVRVKWLGECKGKGWPSDMPDHLFVWKGGAHDIDIESIHDLSDDLFHAARRQRMPTGKLPLKEDTEFFCLSDECDGRCSKSVAPNRYEVPSASRRNPPRDAHRGVVREYDDGDEEELNPEELALSALARAPKDTLKNAEDKARVECIDLVSEDDEPSDTAAVPGTRRPPRFRKRSCVNHLAPIPDDREEREEPDGRPVEGLAHIYELRDGLLHVLFPRDKLCNKAARGDGVGYLRLGLQETLWNAVKLYNVAARAEGAAEQELPMEYLDPSHVPDWSWIHADLRGDDNTGIRMTRTGKFCVRVMKRGETKPTTLGRPHGDIKAAVKAYNNKPPEYGPHKLRLTREAREAAENMRAFREAALPTPSLRSRKTAPEIKRDVCGIKGLHVLYEAFTEEVERTLFSHGELFPFGPPAPDATEKRQDSTLGLKQMPDDIMRVANLVRDSGLCPTLITPDHVMSQSYPPGAGFMAHVDDNSRWGDDNSRWGECVVGVSLGADGVLYFQPNCKNQRAVGNQIRKHALENDFADYPTKSGVAEDDTWRDGRGSRVKKGEKSWALELEIPRRFIYVMTGAARTDLEHGVRAVSAPSKTPDWNKRGVRRSLTIRAQKPYSDATLEHLAKQLPRDASIHERIAAQALFKTAFDGTSYANTGREGAERARKYSASNAATRLRFAPSGVGSAFVLETPESEAISEEPGPPARFGCSRCRHSPNGCYDSVDIGGRVKSKGCRGPWPCRPDARRTGSAKRPILVDGVVDVIRVDDDDENNEELFEPPPPEFPRISVHTERKRKRDSLEREWEVDRIVGKRLFDDGETHYKVAWSGTDRDGRPWKPSWEPSSNLNPGSDPGRRPRLREAVARLSKVVKRSEGDR